MAASGACGIWPSLSAMTSALRATPTAATSHGQPTVPAAGKALRTRAASSTSLVASQIHGPSWIAQVCAFTGGLNSTNSTAKATTTSSHQRTRVLNSSCSEPLHICAATTAMNVGANSPNMAGAFTPNRRRRRRQQQSLQPTLRKDRYAQTMGRVPTSSQRIALLLQLPYTEGIPSSAMLAETVPEKLPTTTHLFRFL